MLSDEEEAIEWLKRLVKINKRDNLDDTFAEILLNLIEKQSKEIEELNSDLEVFKRALTDVEVVYNKNYTSNDKIKAKIEELDKEEKQKLKGTKGQDRYAIKQEYMYKRSVFQSLLEKE